MPSQRNLSGRQESTPALSRETGRRLNLSKRCSSQCENHHSSAPRSNHRENAVRLLSIFRPRSVACPSWTTELISLASLQLLPNAKLSQKISGREDTIGGLCVTLGSILFRKFEPDTVYVAIDDPDGSSYLYSSSLHSSPSSVDPLPCQVVPP